MDLTAEDFRNWSPIRLSQTADGVFVDWCFLGDKRFTEPFHDHTIEALWQKPFNLLFRRQTPIDFLGEIFEKSPGVKPKGFIFHVSRCGSTLVSQMLASQTKNIVISEASVLDRAIRPDYSFADAAEETKITRLRWLVNALAQKRFADEENFFIKFDSWSVLELPLIEQAFPEVPWIFLYRNPVEVIVSNIRQPGAQMIPGAIQNIFPNLNLYEILQFSIEERFARTIAAFCEYALANAASKNGKFINYSQLPEAVTGEICAHFNIKLTEPEIESINTSAKFDAKMPQSAFTPDGERKRMEAGEKIEYFAEKIVAPLYEKLEDIRLGRTVE